MADKTFPKSGIPIRKSSDFLPQTFRSEANEKFFAGTLDPLIQPGSVDKITGYFGRRYGKTYKGSDIYLDTDQTLRSRYQLEPGVTVEKDQEVLSFHDYLDFKNTLKFFGNGKERDDLTTFQENYSWNPPIDWDKFINYREYYWVPGGPPTVAIYGQTNEVQSTYKVNQGIGPTWVFTPDGLTNNPTLTLYRGQTYKFNVNSPNEGFFLRTNYDTGSLNYDPNRTYFAGQLAVYNQQLWRALREISPADGSSIDINSQDWELADDRATNESLNYNTGVTNNGIEVGTITFEVPLNAPDVIYYQSGRDPNRLGRFIIADIDSNTFINVENEIIGKEEYTSANGIKLSNGMVLEFRGQVESEKYASDTWLVEGVGKEIHLIKFSDLVPPSIAIDNPDILFDNEGFDTQPFDDASQYPAQKDYVTINRSGKDSNPWSRYNRWFHRSVLEYSFKLRDEDFDSLESSRAKRPIIEFHPNIQLFNHGGVAKATVDYIDDYTIDIFSTIEGSGGYSIDGEFLFDGARILVTADTDSLANNKIYKVNFITHNGKRQINLSETADSASILNECVLVRRGKNNAGKMFHFNGTRWVSSQQKTRVNQEPLFDIFDSSSISFSDSATYPVSSFIGSKIFSYKVGNGLIDKELGFSLSYLNIDNVGDILFDWNIDSDNFSFTINQTTSTLNINTGFYSVNGILDNGWTKTSREYLQPIVDSYKVESETSTIQLDTVDWNNLTDTAKINFYLNGEKINTPYVRENNQFTFETAFAQNDIVSIKIVDNIEPNQGYYEIPVGIEKNPLNEKLTQFTLGQSIDHVKTSLEFDSRFSGTLPGVCNLRDLSDFQKNAKRFLKHSGISASAIELLCDKNVNLIKSLQYAKKAYSVFRDNFIKKAIEIDFVDNTNDMVDSIIEELTKTKSNESPFADSDMIGSGAFTKIDYLVSDPGIKTFSLSENFNLESLSRKAVYIYRNNLQLLTNRDYTFNSTFGYATLNIELNEGDTIEIREYVSTSFSHIPPTPTSLGLYKKYTPMKFVDDTYREPQEVIQGHDGSITIAYGDFRDDLLLELEYRIYNNIKTNYDPKVFDIDANLGGYYGNSLFTKEDFDSVANQEFLKWVANTNLGYTENTYFKENETFTYTYSNMSDPTKTENLPGWWRGVYKYFYDTDRPHRCPWEILGFSEKPTWWDEEYGAAPYTSGNLILWEDIRDGIIRHGDRAGTYSRYARPTILDHIPCDCDGNLLSPLDSGLATNFTLINNKGSFKLGDVSPTEYAYRSSPEFPFVIVMSLCLLRPFEYIISNFDKSKTKRNAADQIIDISTGVFITPKDLTLPVSGETQTSGLSCYISSYVKSTGNTVDTAQDNLTYLNVRLSNRLSGFVDKEQQKYLLYSKSPASASSSIFIPTENYDIRFNVSSPIASIVYSGVILEKSSGGWIVNGYDDVNPYFNYYKVVPNQKDPTISVGGVSDTFVVWAENTLYNNGQIVEYRNDYYRANSTHTSLNVFEVDNWRKLPELPIKGAITAQRRRNFNKFSSNKISYGTKLTSIQQVVDFLFGYQEYLQDNGFVFDNYDPDNQVVQDFVTSAKEFMFWTAQNWALGSLITLSPGAQRLRINIPIGVADNLIDGFYEYNVLKDNGEPLDVKNINVTRDFQTFVISTTNTSDGIYYLKANYVLKEHVTIFDDRTVFNDIIYDKPTGYRQERIKTQGFRTVDWDGDYTSPGFLFDNVKIAVWQPFNNYRLGDIVSYKAVNYTSKFNHTSGENFDENRWTILDSTPEKQLIPNYDYRINQIEDYFDVASQGLGQSQRDLARHTIGYQNRQYLQNLAEDEVTQFRLFQGFIREKGTNNSIRKLFDKIGRATGSGVDLYEEWAFKLGELGGSAQSKNIEINLITENFKINPQPILVTETKTGDYIDRYYRIDKSDFYYAPVPYTTHINPVSYDAEPTRTAGYVKLNQVDFTLKNRDDILNLDITQVSDNDHFWITFDNASWTVLRINYTYDLPILDITTEAKKVTLRFGKRHNLSVDDIIGIPNIGDIQGFHKITEVSTFTLSFEVELPPSDTGFEPSTLAYPLIFSEARFDSYEVVDPQEVALLKQGSKLFIDENGNNQWEVVGKNRQYNPKQILQYGTTDPLQAGKKVIYSELQKQTIASIPGSELVVAYVESTNGLSVKQLLEPQAGFVTAVRGVYGHELAVSPDSKWLAIGTPLASGVSSNYRGIFNTITNYSPNDIVLYNGKLYKANIAVLGDGSTINVDTQDWTQIDNVEALELGSNDGYTNQGMISLYQWSSQQWNYVTSYVSPRPESDRLFGTKIVFAKTTTGYKMAVSAPGAENNKGRVYLYTNDGQGTNWDLDDNPNYMGVYEPGGTLPVTDIKPGRTYTISSVGTTNFVTLGASANIVGKEFVASEVGIGTGVVTQTTYYPEGSIVYNNGYLWQATADNYGDGSTISIESNDWIRLDEVATSASLPQSVSIEDDGSTLASGILSSDQLAELIKEGDKFGSQLAFNYDGTRLIISSALSDGQYFPNYRGIWQPNFEYSDGDVVKYQGSYHKLVNEGPFSVAADSTIRSFNQEPDAGLPWTNVGDSTSEPVGKVFVYELTSIGYKLRQTITSGSLSEISDLDPSETISSGDLFGHAIDVDYSGKTLVVTSPKADLNAQNQGSAYIFKFESDSSENRFRLKQKIESFGKYPNEYFGQSVCISSNTEKVIIGAHNSVYASPIRFDQSQTSFDQGKTSFRSYSGFSGAVYVFEQKDGIYFLAEKLEDDLSPNESFGYSVDCTRDLIVVGSPDYILPSGDGPVLEYTGAGIGLIRLFKKNADKNSLEILGQKAPRVDLENIKRIALYDKDSDEKLQDIEVVDPAKLKILASAERELSYKTPYDPAIYNVGNEDVVVDESISWYEKNVGKLWWNISTAKWLDYEQGDISYRLGNWGRLVEGSSIDVYEWVESKLLPSEWSAVADSNEGLQLGISGQPLYPNDQAYTTRQLFNNTTGQPTETKYYYWVKNKVTIPDGTLGRTISASNVSSLISDPSSLGNTFIGLAASDKIIFFNYTNLVSNDSAILNIEYYNQKESKNAVHNEYQLLTEGVEDSLPAEKLERKWIDSLVGYDQQGNRVPDPDLPEKQRHGIKFRPRQSMFIDRKNILQTTIELANETLMKEAFADVINFEKLNLLDSQPSELLYLYDVKVSTLIDLETVGTVRVKKAVLSANIIDNEISSIDIIDPGFGYKPQELFDQEVPGLYKGPAIQIDGDGVSAEAITHIDGQGRIVNVVVTRKGEKYTYANINVRYFSVLVENDNTANNFWSIYAWDDERQVFFRSASQAFDTTKYWNYVDWWKKGYSATTRIIREILDVSQEPTINPEIGDLIRIKEYGAGGWAVFRKIAETATNPLDNYELVGRRNGTIQLSSNLYDIQTSGIGFDNVKSFDTGLYDLEPTIELRNILLALKEDILIGDYASEWNRLFFVSVRYVFHEQTYVDWAFKTSFLNATHNIGEFKQTSNYKNDSLESYLDYVNEVKPYRTTIREYVSKYDNIERSYAGSTDFDLPSVYNQAAGKIITVNESSDEITLYPWKWWLDNKGYGIVEIKVSSPGSGYTSPPTVVIEGNGTGAQAQAYISSGKVSGIRVLNQGSGYTITPVISLVGGNGSSTDKAKAVPILGNNKARTMDISIKFDRINKVGYYSNFSDTQTFTASGSSSVFELKYAPTRDKSKINITINGQLVLGSDYTISLYRSNLDEFKILRGKITFNTPPALGDIINISYEKNDELLDSVNRIQKYYNPTSGMKGTDLDQLMTGIDYGGVQIQGTTFDVTGGWDALPWFTDSWDSVQASADYYVVCDGSTNFVTLPYTPADGQEINVYIKRAGVAIPPTIDQLQYSQEIIDPPVIRIDDPYYLQGNDSSTSPNPNAEMPTFIGDGSTNFVEIGKYVQTNDGDILIFRPVESDGSVTITDPNIIDTQVSGGTLERSNNAYTNAQGINAEEIKIEGGRFIGPEQVAAPEENIPGQVLDSLSIKVYNITGSGVAPVNCRVIKSDGSTTLYDIGQKVIENKSTIIYVDDIKQVENTDYTIDITNSTVEFTTAPNVDSEIEILSIGIGGVSILDYQEFIADGETGLFLTNANYNDTAKILVTVDGIEKDAVFVDSTGVVDTFGRTLVQFGSIPAENSIIKILTLGSTVNVADSLKTIVRINQQSFTFDGSTRNLELDNFVSLQRESSLASVVVEVNGTKLIGVDTVYEVYDGTNNNFVLGTDPEESAGAILSSNISVYINGEQKTFIQDFIYNGATKVLTITANLQIGDIIKIENNLRTQYSISDNDLIIDPSVSLTEGDDIEVTWFSEYPSMGITSDRNVGGKVNYKLPFVPLGVSYVWVYKNGIRLTQDIDYYISLPRGVIYLNETTTTSDVITITTFGTSIYRLPSAYELSKDMLNIYRFNRYSTDTEVKLANSLKYYDDEIVVTDASNLFEPNLPRNLPGTVIINNEKIEYMIKSGNRLLRLRRGVQGTAIAEEHAAGSYVVDAGYNENIPYTEEQNRTDFVSDGSSLLIGPLNFVPNQTNDPNWTSTTIPVDYGRCDVLEVFVGGKRLRKTSITVFDESLGPTSPEGDRTLEAEFAVDGINPFVRLTNVVSAGTRITIIKRTGKTWYDRGENTASAGITLLENSTPISKFIAAKTTRLPE